jgi:hypothetical protein
VTASRIFGIVLIVIGIVALAYGGFAYTTRDKVIDVGAIEVTKEDREFVPLPPILGGGAILVGAALLVASARRGR